MGKTYKDDKWGYDRDLKPLSFKNVKKRKKQTVRDYVEEVISNPDADDADYGLSSG